MVLFVDFGSDQEILVLDLLGTLVEGLDVFFEFFLGVELVELVVEVFVDGVVHAEELVLLEVFVVAVFLAHFHEFSEIVFDIVSDEELFLHNFIKKRF